MDTFAVSHYAPVALEMAVRNRKLASTTPSCARSTSKKRLLTLYQFYSRHEVLETPDLCGALISQTEALSDD